MSNNSNDLLANIIAAQITQQIWIEIKARPELLEKLISEVAEKFSAAMVERLVYNDTNDPMYQVRQNLVNTVWHDLEFTRAIQVRVKATLTARVEEISGLIAKDALARVGRTY